GEPPSLPAALDCAGGGALRRSSAGSAEGAEADFWSAAGDAGASGGAGGDCSSESNAGWSLSLAGDGAVGPIRSGKVPMVTLVVAVEGMFGFLLLRHRALLLQLFACVFEELRIRSADANHAQNLVELLDLFRRFELAQYLFSL